MFASGMLGHTYFISNNITFDTDIGRTAIIGATISMIISLVLSVIVIRGVSDVNFGKGNLSIKNRARHLPSNK
ncbi:MAG TPA: hypothetical protein TECP_00657 [Hyphomicrobiaceae bacterium MAG_BT-2024]